MDDAMIRRLAEGGGVIQINFGSAFISGEYQQEFEKSRSASEVQMARNGLSEVSEQSRTFMDEYLKGHPLPAVDVEDVADHIDHVVSLVGIEHVGIGSDFDGVGDSLPDGLKDVSQYPNLVRVLLDRGYSAGEVEKICSGNLLRVWEEVERHGRVSGGAEGQLEDGET
jgi:membrane dipeptidase